MKSNCAGLGCANLNKVPKDKNSFLADDAKLALGKFWSRNEKVKMNKCSTRRILLSASFKAFLLKYFVFSFLVRRKNQKISVQNNVV